MPSPSTSVATLRPDLGGSMEAFDRAMDREGFISLKVAPVFEAPKSSGKFGKIPIEQLLKNRDTARAPGSAYSRGNWTFTPASYTTVEHGYEEPVDDNDRENYKDYFEADLIATENAYDALLRAQEKRVADLLFNATTYAGASLTTGVTNEWDDYTNATPIDDVEAAVRKVWTGSGLWPNALILNKIVFRNLRLCAQVRDRISSSGAGSPTKPSDITPAMLAAVFDLEQVLVAGGAQNSAIEGASASIESIWSSEYAMVARVCKRPRDIKEPCVARTFHWSEDGSTITGTVEQYREEKIRSDVFRVRNQTEEQVFHTAAGHLLSNVTTL